MASEIRHLFFLPREVVGALSQYFTHVGRHVPRGEVLRCGPVLKGNDGAVQVWMSVNTAAERSRSLRPAVTSVAEPVQLVVEEADLAAALIFACRRSKIPLPSKAAKSLKVFGERLCLEFTITAVESSDANGHLIF